MKSKPYSIMKKKKLTGLAINKTSVSNLNAINGGNVVLLTINRPFCIGETNPIICFIVSEYCEPITMPPGCPDPNSLILQNCNPFTFDC